MKSPRQLVTFDWALKRLLRAKANFAVLEGFLSELLHDDIRIEHILESESNKESQEGKYNRVDLLVKDGSQRHIIIEIQYAREDDYLQRILYGTSKVITESLPSGGSYKHIARVISVSIVHFDLGDGDDYIYEGTTEFRGVHNQDKLTLTESQKTYLQVSSIDQAFPQYYILKVTNFNDVAKTTLDQWIYFLKNGNIQPRFNAKGLKEAQKALDILKLSEKDRRAYEYFLNAQRVEIGVAQSTILRAEAAEAHAAEALAQKEAAETLAAEERQQKEEALVAREEERRQKEEALAALAAKDSALQSALATLIANGIPEPQARKSLGLE